MPEITINGQSSRYVGEPLTAYMFDGELWGGRSNFDCCNAPATLSLYGLEDCFHWMARWKTSTDDYQCGYVLDFAQRTIYYDTPQALEHLTLRVIPKRGYEGYFQKFIQKEF